MKKTIVILLIILKNDIIRGKLYIKMDISCFVSSMPTNCPCGKIHSAPIDKIIAEAGALSRLPDVIKDYGAKKAFVFADKNTYEAAGKRVLELLAENDIAYSSFVFESDDIKPDEHSVGSAVMHYDRSCDIVVAVGSGVINDIGKILAYTAGVKYIIVATAPSMDGYASGSSSMEMDGLKVSLNSKCADVIIGDIDIMKNCPQRMLISGLGDMIAKYISICEWRISHIITGEYYCENVAELMRSALRKCVSNADGLLQRDADAVLAVFEGLVIGGVAMKFAGLSRPASGVEHYFSHIWDIRGLEFNTPVDLHGIQCALGTLIAARIYEQIKNITPNREKALAFNAAFDYESWKKELCSYLGAGAKAMIKLEEKERKYDVEAHKARLDVIISHWDEIISVINEEIPSSEEIEKLLKKIGAPLTVEEIGLDQKDLGITFKATKDIRDKYVLSRLCQDIGVIDEIVF